MRLSIWLALMLAFALSISWSGCSHKTVDDDTQADDDVADDDTGDDDTETDCTAADLVYTAEARDSSGACTDYCDANDPIDLVGIVTNPCGSDIVLVAEWDCLVSLWEVVNTGTGDEDSIGVECLPVPTQWSIPAGGSLEEVWTYGIMDAGDYQLTVTFHRGPRSAPTTFYVWFAN